MGFTESVIDIGMVFGAYLAGTVPFGLFIGKFNGIDIRKAGSGNIGATNVTRVIGKWWGKLCFLLDFLKGAVPVAFAVLLMKKYPGCDIFGLIPVLTAFAAVSGHMFPVWLGFRGGKGISTAAGAVAALNPYSLIGAGIVWVAGFMISRYVSLASVLAALSLPVLAFTFKYCGIWNASGAELALFAILAALAVVRHISNIKRLIDGTESRFDGKKQ